MQHKIAEIVVLVCRARGGHDSIKPMHATNHPVPSADPRSPQLTTTKITTAQRLLLLGGLLVGFALRLFHLGSESLWYDETVSVVLARKSIPALIAHTAGDIHPPGYYLLLHGWQALVHPTLDQGLEFLFAWPSLFCGLLIVALLFTLGRKLFDQITALVALWLAAVNPFHIWYSQEVRMYTLGALFGLLCLWALIKWWLGAQQPSTQWGWQWGWRWLLLYAVAGALGLYTLYYFLFVLITLNLITALGLVHTRHTSGQPVWRQASQWLLAQFTLLVLWSPWLSIFWRQATEPPVPPWRVAWRTAMALLAAVSEGLSALISGQSAPNPTSLVWLVVMIILLFCVFLGYANKKSQRPALMLLVLYVFLPSTLLYLITYFVNPLYHVRYLFTYAPPFLLLVAAAIVAVGRRQPSLGALTLLTLLLVNGLSLQRFWFADQYRSDDHRAAVAQLAKAWRPGDLILVNAGWAYTALETYWPTALTGVEAALPPSLVRTVRLHDYAQEIAAKKSVPIQAPFLVRTGLVDGAASLGWGDPQSDFFAIDATAATEALLTLSQNYRRIWHYRLYDTVSDPQGQLRAWLAAHGQLLMDQAISGRDYLSLQLYQSNHVTPTAAQLFTPDTARFGDALQLAAISLNPPTVAAGSTLYLQSRWSLPSSDKEFPTTLSFSLRLYSEQGVLLAQQDEAPHPAVATWSTTLPTEWGLALPIPVDTPPGNYQLQLIVYDQSTGVALAPVPGAQMLALGEVTVTTATTVPIVDTRLARFDYIDLIQTTVTAAATVNSGINVTLVWLPQPSDYRDTYLARLALRDGAGNVLQSWEDALGGWHYPSGTWPPLLPVRHDQQLPLAPTTPIGTYRLTLQVQRQSDGTPIPATTSWWQHADEFVLGTVVVQ